MSDLEVSVPGGNVTFTIADLEEVTEDDLFSKNPNHTEYERDRMILERYARRMRMYRSETDYVKLCAANIAEKLKIRKERYQAWVKQEVLDAIVRITKGQKKSFQTIYGTVGYSEIKPKVVVDDKEKLLNYLRENYPQYIREEHTITEVITDEGMEFLSQLEPDHNEELIPVKLFPGTDFKDAEVRLTARLTNGEEYF